MWGSLGNSWRAYHKFVVIYSSLFQPILEMIPVRFYIWGRDEIMPVIAQYFGMLILLRAVPYPLATV